MTTTPRPDVSPVPTGDDALDDLTYFGFIRDVDLDARTLDFDVAQWFTGPAADAAAVEDGAIAPGEGVPNDYYVRNQSTLVRTIPVAPDVVVSPTACSAGCGSNVPGTFDGLAASFGPGSNPVPDLSEPYRGAHTQYWITVRAGAVVRIDEQYVP